MRGEYTIRDGIMKIKLVQKLEKQKDAF